MYSLIKTKSGSYTIRNEKGEATSYNVANIIKIFGEKKVEELLKKYNGKDPEAFLRMEFEKSQEDNSDFDSFENDERPEWADNVQALALREGNEVMIWEGQGCYDASESFRKAYYDAEETGGQAEPDCAVIVSYEVWKKIENTELYDMRDNVVEEADMIQFPSLFIDIGNGENDSYKEDENGVWQIAKKSSTAYKDKLIEDFGVEAWERNVKVWEKKGYILSPETGLLEQISKGKEEKTVKVDNGKNDSKELTKAFVEKVYSNLQKIKDTEDITKKDVEDWAKDYITPDDEITLETLKDEEQMEFHVSNFLDSWDH